MSLILQSFDRICKLTVYQSQALLSGPAASLITAPIGTTFSSKQDDGSPGYRIKFHVDLVTGPVPVPNPAVIHIYNLAQNQRTLVSKLNNKIVLQAGYGLFPQTIFSGQIQYAVTKKEQSDYVTEIHASDGLFAFQNSLINLSFSTPTPASAVITTLVGALSGAGVQPGNMSLGLAAASTKFYNKGIVLSGKVTDELQKVCDKNNLTWTIEIGALNIIPIGAIIPSLPTLLTPDTGLIGIPEQREIDSTGTNSKFIPLGNFITGKITHSGDSFTNDWYTDGECTNAPKGPA